MSEMEFGSTLYRLYHTVVHLEAEALKENKSCSDLTVNELNLIECIRSLTKNGMGPSISAIASALDITRPSTTVAVNKLCSKKIAAKSECAKDGRSVRVKLTPKGEKAYSAHHAFQSSLIKSARSQFSEEEFNSICGTLAKLGDFFETAEKDIEN